MMTSHSKEITLQKLFDIQAATQNVLLSKGVYDRFMSSDIKTVPVDDIGLVSYHIQQLISEIGEILTADKRWKSHRNDKYNKQEKLEEIADCFIVLMNVAMFSGFNGDELAAAIVDKLNVVSNRLI